MISKDEIIAYLAENKPAFQERFHLEGLNDKAIVLAKTISENFKGMIL